MDFDAFQNITENNKQINSCLIYEKKSIQDYYLNEHISNGIKDQFKEIEKLWEAIWEKREQVDQVFLQIKEQYKEESNAHIGLVYVNRHKKLQPKMVEFLKVVSREYGVNIICFKINDVNVEKKCVKGILISGDTTKTMVSQIPPFIYNMGYFSKPENMRIMKQLRRMNGVEVINPVNRFNQSIIFDMVSAFNQGNKILLPYGSFSKFNFQDYLKKYDVIYLLPEKKGDKRKGIVIEKNNGEYGVSIGGNKEVCRGNNLYDYIIKIIQNKRYMIIKGVNAIKLKNTPLEARVYIQRGRDGQWQVVQTVGKFELFSQDSIYKDTHEELKKFLSRVMPEKAERIAYELEENALTICSYLEKYLDHLGSCLLDFLITDEGNFHFIYFGGWEEKELLLGLDGGYSWWNYFENAVDYLIYLDNKNKEIRDEK